jgi:hypothetical protein
MTTLIATYSGDGCTGRCDARCYEAVTSICNCICGGRNHGAGVERATESTREFAEEWLSAWKREHPDTIYWSIPAAQLALSL